MTDASLSVTVIDACLRDGAGGSPTAVLADRLLEEPARRRVAPLLGTSHAVFVARGDDGRASLRFFTRTGELPACGHGTVAALAYLAAVAARRELQTELHTAGGTLPGTAVAGPDGIEASFAPGVAVVRRASRAERALAAGVLGLTADLAWVGSLGRTRLLVPVGSRADLTALAPDLDRLRTGCDRLGLLGCCVHTAPSSSGRLSARMFAPSIGVPEDIANANSAACLAAMLAPDGLDAITVDMGDCLGRPATITARAQRVEAGFQVRVGGRARVNATRTVALDHLAGEP